MGEEFFDKYGYHCHTSKAVLCNLLKVLVGDSSLSICAAEKGVSDHVAQAVLELDDPEIVLDLCSAVSLETDAQFMYTLLGVQ